MVYSLDDLKSVFIGRRGENNARVVEFDITPMLEAYPDASYSIMMLRNGENTAFLCDTLLSDNILAWRITNICTAIPGIHQFEIRATQSGQLVKSKRAYALIEAAVGDDSGEDVPSPLETWEDRIDAVLAFLEDNAPSTSDDLDYILGV